MQGNPALVKGAAVLVCPDPMGSLWTYTSLEPLGLRRCRLGTAAPQVLFSAQACVYCMILVPNPPFVEPLGAGPVLPAPTPHLPSQASFPKVMVWLCGRCAQQGLSLHRGHIPPLCTAMQWRSRCPWDTRWPVTSPASSGASSPWVSWSLFPSPPK